MFPRCGPARPAGTPLAKASAALQEVSVQLILPLLSFTLCAGCADEISGSPEMPVRGPADPVQPSTLTEALAASDAAFSGTVKEIEYRLSEPDIEGHQVPFTFVTWHVEHGFRGVEGGGDFTLRCLGGDRGNGHVMFVSTLPVFQVGDEDIIFVQTDDHNACPLVGAVNGRLRLVDGHVYDNFGTTLSLTNDALVAGEWRYIERANVFDVGAVHVQRNISVGDESVAVGMDSSVLLDRLAEISATLPDLAQAPSADASSAIIFENTRPYEN